jgi:hypothetical protein
MIPRYGREAAMLIVAHRRTSVRVFRWISVRNAGIVRE